MSEAWRASDHASCRHMLLLLWSEFPFRCSLANQMCPISWDLNGKEAYSPGVLMAFRRDEEPLPGVLHFH